jgi:dTDP-4-amino-4,6-dideoxygalactose transaminase
VNTIPPLDLARQYQIIGDEISTAVQQVLASGRYIGGAMVQELETQFAAYTGVERAIACNSGTDALYLALRAYNIGAGDEVITSSFTFFSTAEVITLVGATPVFIDIDPQNFNFDPQQLAAAITPKTKAIMPVHLFGYPADMTTVMAVARQHNLLVIEDCAQATGAMWDGQKVGSIGHVGCFSFFPTKNLGACGDGGMVTTNDPEIATIIQKLREHGSNIRYYHELIGINSRLDTLQAAILQIKLRYLDRWNQARHEVAQRYQELLSPIPGIILPQVLAPAQSVWNQYTIRIQQQGENQLANSLGGLGDTESRSNLRDQVREKMQSQGVSSMVYYPIPLHLQPVYKNLGYQLGQLPHTDRTAQEVLSLPMFPEITLEEQQRVAYALKDALQEISSD